MTEKLRDHQQYTNTLKEYTAKYENEESLFQFAAESPVVPSLTDLKKRSEWPLVSKETQEALEEIIEFRLKGTQPPLSPEATGHAELAVDRGQPVSLSTEINPEDFTQGAVPAGGTSEQNNANRKRDELLLKLQKEANAYKPLMDLATSDNPNLQNKFSLYFGSGVHQYNKFDPVLSEFLNGMQEDHRLI